MKNIKNKLLIFSFVIFGLLLGYSFAMSMGLLYADIIDNILSNITKGYLIVFLISLVFFFILLKKVNNFKQNKRAI